MVGEVCWVLLCWVYVVVGEECLVLLCEACIVVGEDFQVLCGDIERKLVAVSQAQEVGGSENY